MVQAAFQAGEIRSRNGWDYERQPDGRWRAIRPTAGGAQTPSLVPIGPPDPHAVATEQRAQAAEARAEESAARADRAEARAVDATERANTIAGRLPAAAQSTLNETAGIFRSLRQAQTGFNNNYAGNLVGGIENQLQSVNSDIGTPGQRDWWAAFRRSDVGERNQLFGASLTPSEAASFAATTVSPSMDPREVRRNIARRAEAARQSLLRQREVLAANGYNAEAIDALIGPDLLGVLDQPIAEEAAGQVRGGGDSAPADDMLTVNIEGGRLPRNLDEASPEFTSAYARAKERNPSLTFAQFIASMRDGSEPSPSGPSPGFLERNLGRPLALGVGDLAEGAGDILGLVGNPVNAGINAITGANIGTDIGASARDLTGAPDPAGFWENVGSAVNRSGVGGFGLSGAARAGAPLATGALESALTRFGATPLTDTLAGASSGASSEIVRQAGGGPVLQTTAALLGGGAAVPVASALEGALARPGVVDSALTRAGREEGVTVNRAMVDPSLQTRITGVDRTIIGGRITGREMGAIDSQIEGRVRDLGRGGVALEPEVAGQTIERAGRRFIEQSGRQARREYDAAEVASEGVRVQPTRSLAVVDEMIGKLSETPETNGAEIAFLNRIRNDLQNDLSVGALRGLRTRLRKLISNGGLVFGDDEARVLSIMDEASTDIENGLRAAGRERAATLFRTADNNYRQRMEFINNTVQRLIGRRNDNLPPERIFNNLRAMATPRGDEAALGRMLDRMEPEEQADIAATFAEALGRNNKGNFSTAAFASQVERLPRAARLHLFGERGEKSVQNLIRLTREAARVRGAMGGSPTSLGNDWRSWLYTTMLGSGAGAGAGVLTQSGMTGLATTGGILAAKGARDALSARALMSPNVQRWLRSAPEGNSRREISRHITRLGTIAAREPALAAELQQLEQTLMGVANDNLGQVGRSVARDNEENRQDERR